MAQGEFTKQECDHALRCVDSLINAIPKSKKYNYLGELNDICLLLEAAKKAAPEGKGRD
jgi:hypothetical protein